MSALLRQIIKRQARLEARLNSLIMLGTAEENKGAKTRVRFDDKGQGGRPFRSPLIAQANSAGFNGQGVSAFTRIGINEPVLVFNPGGVISRHSRVLPAGHVADHPSPGAAEQDGHVLTIGSAKVEVRDGLIRFSVGDSRITMTNSMVDIRAGASSTNWRSSTVWTVTAIFSVDGWRMEHNGFNNGSSHTHGGILPGGSNTATPNP
jgi:hypothetical protein